MKTFKVTILAIAALMSASTMSAQDEVENRRPYRLGRSGRQWTSGTIIPLRKASISEADTPQTLTR